MDFQPKKLPSYEYLMNVFKSADKNNSGAISAEELQEALSDGSWRPFNIKVVRQVIELFDDNNSGTINFVEFGDLWKYLTGWENCFRSFDRDNSGTIDRRELKTALNNLGYLCNFSEAYDFVDEFDRSGDGSLDFDDFIEVCITAAKRCFGKSIHDNIGLKMNF